MKRLTSAQKVAIVQSEARRNGATLTTAEATKVAAMRPDWWFQERRPDRAVDGKAMRGRDCTERTALSRGGRRG